MEDKIERIGKGTVIQHGKYNDRIYLMKLSGSDFPEVLNALRGIARENGYTKIFCKVPEWAAPGFLSDGYLMEAFIPRFYKEKESVFFLSKYLNSDRLLGVEYASLNAFGILLKEGAGRAGKDKKAKKPGKKYEIKQLNRDHVEQITDIYREVFLSYPFPIHNPGYILKTMKEQVQYFGVEKKGKIIALASAEVDRKGSNAEMTDFATLPDHRGLKLSTLLLAAMEKEMKREGISTLYTIARLNSMAMNRTFLRCGYRYAGTLIRNTNIAGKIESMNVLYKHM